MASHDNDQSFPTLQPPPDDAAEMDFGTIPSVRPKGEPDTVRNGADVTVDQVSPTPTSVHGSYSESNAQIIMTRNEASVAYQPPTRSSDTDAVEVPVTDSHRAEPVMAGVSVPGYRVQSLLGRGGMGVVYKAVQIGLKRTVALKMVTGDKIPSKSELIRFLAEAELIAAISDPNVVQVYEYGETDGKPFLALEYLPGGNLAELLRKKGRFEPKQAAELALQVVRGVAAAHKLGIIHRDLKPQNVMIGAEGELKVTDFGLAKRGSGQELTHTGAVLGTPAYMAPEQAKGNTKFVGPQADVWALGVILYELMTGKRPFDAADIWGLLSQVTSLDPEKPRKLASDIPLDLERICLHCMTREPESRYPTAAEMAADLDRFLAGEEITIRAPGRVERLARWAKRKPAAAAAWGLSVVVVGLSVFGGSVASLWVKAEKAKDAAVIAHQDAETARKRAEEEERAATAARDALAVEKKQTEVAYLAEQSAKKKESEARELAERATDRERKANDELRAIRYGNTVGLAHREYQANELQRARVLLEENKPVGNGWEWDYLNRVCNGDVLRIDPRAGRAYSVAFTADGAKLVTAHADGTARVWDAKTGKALQALRPDPAGGKPAEILDAAASPDGRRVVTAGADGVVRVWETGTGDQITQLRAGDPGTDDPSGKADVRTVAYRPDGKAFAAAGSDGVVRVWDATDFKEVRSVPAKVGAINSVRYSPDGNWLAVGGHGGGIKVWESDAKEPAFVVPPLKDPVAAVAVTNDARLAVGDTNGAVRIWDLRDGKVVAGFRAHVGKVAAVTFTNDGARLATAGTDRVVRVWDGKTGDRLLTLKGHTDASWGVAFDPAGKRLASSGLDGTARVWDLTRPPEGWLLPTNTARVNALTVSGDGTLLALGGPDRKVKVFAVTDNGPKATDAPEAKSRTLVVDAEADTPKGGLAVRFADDGKSILSLTSAGELVRWESDGAGWKPAGDGTTLPTGAPITGASISGTNGRLVIGRETGEVSVTEVNGLRTIAAWVAHKAPVLAVAFGPGGETLVTGAKDGTVKIWDVATRRAIATAGHPAEVLAAAVSPDGNLVATTSADHTTRVWDAKTGAQVWNLQGHLHWVRAVGFSPDGRRIVTGSQDGVVKMWDVATGYELLSLSTQTDGVTGVAFGPDGKKLYAGGADGLVRVYDANPLTTASDSTSGK